MSERFFKDESRKNYYRETQGPLSDEELQLGCLMRIADSLERMEQPYIQALKSVERLERSCDLKILQLERTHNRIAGLKSYITRLKKEREVLCQKRKKR